MENGRGEDREYLPIEAMKDIARRLHRLFHGDLVVWAEADGSQMRFQHEGNIARVLMLDDNLAVANGDSGTPVPMALDGKITEYNVTAAVSAIEGYLMVGY